VSSTEAMLAIEPILDTVPQYEDFLTFAEIRSRSAVLADTYPDSLRIETIGESAEGRPLELLVVGNTQSLDTFGPEQGRRTALIFGAPHPNEPSGVHTSFVMAEYFAKYPNRLQDFGFDTLLVLPAADVDGLVLNEDGFKGFSPEKYLENFYRPPFKDQPEWSFPINIPELGLFFDQPMPVAAALATVMDTWRPRFVGSLHNSWTETGAYFTTNRHVGKLAGIVQEFSERYGIPLHQGPNEQPYGQELYPGVYTHASRIVETVWNKIHGKANTKEAGGSYDYLLRHALAGKNYQAMIEASTLNLDGEAEDHPSHIVTEIPGFVWVPDANAPSEPSGMTKYQAMIEGVRLQQTNVEILRAGTQGMSGLPEGPLLDTVMKHIGVWDDYLKRRMETLSEGIGGADDSEILTQAEAFQWTHVQPLMWLLGYIGILSRLAEQGGHTTQAEQLRQHITRSVGALATYGELKLRPIHDVVCMQLGAIAAGIFLQGRQSAIDAGQTPGLGST